MAGSQGVALRDVQLRRIVLIWSGFRRGSKCRLVAGSNALQLQGRWRNPVVTALRGAWTLARRGTMRRLRSRVRRWFVVKHYVAWVEL